jgi:hypothetical protein
VDDLPDFLLSVVKTILYIIEVAIYLATCRGRSYDLITYLPGSRRLRAGAAAVSPVQELPLRAAMTGYPMRWKMRSPSVSYMLVRRTRGLPELADDAGDVFCGVGDNLLERMPFRRTAG